MTSGTLNRLLQPTVFKGFLIFVILFGTLMMGCDKEEPCSCEEPFVEPAWVKEIQTEIENDPFICFADMSLYLKDNQYFIYQRSVIDTTLFFSNILYNCKGIILGTDNNYDFIENYSKEAEKLKVLWNYANKDCIWEPNFNEDCGTLEKEPGKIIIGRWKRIKQNMLISTEDNFNLRIYNSVKYPVWLEFKENGDLVYELYSSKNVLIQRNETYRIDSLLNMHNINFPLEYEFSYCNNAMRLFRTTPYYEDYIYERINN